MSSTLRNRKFAFVASFRLSLAQAQVALPPSDLGWMAPNSAPHIPSWLEYFQLMRETSGISPTASQQMECRRRSKSEPPCRPNIEPGVGAGLQRAGGG